MMKASQEVLRKAEKGLWQAIYELTWAGQLWGRWGAIRLSRLRAEFLEALGESAGALSSLSSTYYTAAGTAGSLAQQTKLPLKPFWMLRAVWYLWSAMRLSDRLEATMGLAAMSADQLDVRSRILFKAHRYQDALRCADEALGRNTVSLDSRALLLMGRAETLAAMGKRQEAQLIYQKVLELLDRVKPTTSVRLLKSLSRFYLQSANPKLAVSYFGRALEVARQHNLHDQELKIQALMK